MSSSYYSNTSLGTSYDSSLDVDDTVPPPPAVDEEQSSSSADEEVEEVQQQQASAKAPLPSIANSLSVMLGEEKMSSPPSLRELAMALDMQSEAQWQLARVAAGSLKRYLLLLLFSFFFL